MNVLVDFMNSAFGAKLIFVLTGLSSTIITQMLVYQGAANSKSLLPVFANYFGMMLPLFYSEYSFSFRQLGRAANIAVMSMSFIDILANASATSSIGLIGSGLFQVLYSSVVVVTALWSSIFLHRTLTMKTKLSIFGCMVGLLISAYGTKFGNENAQFSQLLGIFFAMVTVFLYASAYVGSEYVLSPSFSGQISAETLQTGIGIEAVLLTLVWIIFYTLPNWTELMIEPVIAHNGSWTYIFILYMSLVVSQWLHNVTFFILIRNVGAVNAGILQTLRAVLVFVTSALLYCSSDEHQCFSLQKGIATVIVICSVTYYSLEKEKEGLITEVNSKK